MKSKLKSKLVAFLKEAIRAAVAAVAGVAGAAAEICFTFTPDTQNLGAAILRKFAGARGFSVTIR